MGRPRPMLMVCDDPGTEEYFLALAGNLPILAAGMDLALQGPLTGTDTVWRSPTGGSVGLHCLRRNRH